MTHQYELMVILDPEIDERTVAPSLDKFLNVIRNDGGSSRTSTSGAVVAWPTRSRRRPRASTPSSTSPRPRLRPSSWTAS